MKKIPLIIISLIILYASGFLNENAANADSLHNYEKARGLANFLEDHYDIAVIIGEECDSINTKYFDLGKKPSGRTPFLNMVASADYEEDIELIDDALSYYPPGFFSTFKCGEAPKGLRIIVPDQIIANNTVMAGVTTIQDGYYNIFLGVGAFNSTNVHHEIYHAMEYRITYDNPDAFNKWDQLNPPGFVYTDDYLKQITCLSI